MHTRGITQALLGVVCLAVWAQHAVAGSMVIDTAVSWSGTVILEDWVEVHSGGVLTIQPGTTVIFDEVTDAARQGNIRVFEGGTMNAVGTVENPITFTAAGASQAPGGWAALGYEPGSSGMMAHCVVEYAGQWITEGGILIHAAGVTVRDTVVRDCLHYGIELSGPGNASVIEDVTVMDCGNSAIRQRTANMSPSYSGLALSGNLWDGVEVEEAEITQAVNWVNTSAPFIVDGWVEVGTGGILSIGQGVTVAFKDTDSAAQSRIFALDGGTLAAVGTELAPVRFTSALESPAAGDWNTIAFNAGSSGELTHCEVEYGGQFFDSPALLVSSSDVTLGNVTVRDCIDDGIRLSGTGITPQLDDLIVEDCGGAAVLLTTDDMNPSIGNNLLFNGNLHDGIYVLGGGDDLFGTVLWNVTAVPYIVQDWLEIGSGGQLTVGAGVTVQFAPADSFLQSLVRVLDGGAFTVSGTSGSEVLLTSYQDVPAPGDWAFVNMQDGGALSLEHCVVEYAGHAGNGAVLVDGPGATVMNATIRHALDEGVIIGEDSGAPMFDGLAVQNGGGWPVVQLGLVSTPTYANLTLDNNVPGDVVLIDTLDEPITGAVTLGPVGAAFGLRGWATFENGSSLTVMPGTTVQFAPDSSALQTNIVMESGSTLTANGTEAAPIQFTSVDPQPQPGDWAFISVESGASAVFDYCLIEYGGQWFSPGMLGIGDSNVTLTNSILRYSASEGLDIFGGAQPTLSGNQILGNAYGALNRTPENVVDATGTWWGDPSGPLHAATNPGGLGNEVSDGILFDPYMEAPSGKPVLNAGPQFLSFDFEGGSSSVIVFNSGGGELDWTSETIADGDWLSVGAAKGAPGVLSVVVSENATAVSRTGTIRIADSDAIGSPVDVTVFQEAGPEPGTLEEEAAEELLEMFAALDVNGDGVLVFDEVMSFLEDYLGTAKGSTTAQELFDTLDADMGGDLSVGELRQTARFSAVHGGDLDGDGAWTLTELLRVVQLFNAGSYSCGVNGGATEDGYLPGDTGTTDCTRHSADYGDPAWALDLSEVLRVVQLYNVGTYAWCPEQATEDGYCLDPTR